MARKKSQAQFEREISDLLLQGENLNGIHVTMVYDGRELLGTIRRSRRDTSGNTILTVHYFNGESWPIEPFASSVRVI